MFLSLLIIGEVFSEFSLSSATVLRFVEPINKVNGYKIVDLSIRQGIHVAARIAVISNYGRQPTVIIISENG